MFFQPMSGKSRATSNDNSPTTSGTSSSSATASNQNGSGSQQAYKNGEYVGKSTATEWGNVQLKVKITNNKISQITVLKYPDTHSHSFKVNQQSLPIYRKEALKEQSANINQISGATETWKGFTGSLQSALMQARQA
ncbi:MAG: FMN-binding protein [Liquorilactobacillus satsumensis]